jgi:hypothetical protein
MSAPVCRRGCQEGGQMLRHYVRDCPNAKTKTITTKRNTRTVPPTQSETTQSETESEQTPQLQGLRPSPPIESRLTPVNSLLNPPATVEPQSPPPVERHLTPVNSLPTPLPPVEAELTPVNSSHNRSPSPDTPYSQQSPTWFNRTPDQELRTPVLSDVLTLPRDSPSTFPYNTTGAAALIREALDSPICSTPTPTRSSNLTCRPLNSTMQRMESIPEKRDNTIPEINEKDTNTKSKPKKRKLEYIVNPRARVARFNQYKIRLAQSMIKLGTETGCSGALYLRKYLIKSQNLIV